MKKLNLGCGSIKLDGYVNADITERVNPDVLVPALPKKLPFKDKEFDEVLFDNCFQYIAVKDIVPSLYELCRIGKKVICNFNPKNQVGSTIWQEGMHTIGFGINDVRTLSNKAFKRDFNKSWKPKPFDFNITKIWFELKLEEKFPVNLVKKWVNKSRRNQTIYENTFLYYLFQPKWVWIQIEEEE